MSKIMPLEILQRIGASPAGKRSEIRLLALPWGHKEPIRNAERAWLDAMARGTIKLYGKIQVGA
jgi:hypothetical protein